MSESTSSRDENAGEVVFSRSAGIGDQADDWDDTSLIEAYDAALGGILDKLDKRQQRQPQQKASSSSQGASTTQTKWKRGDFCKAQYSEDQQWYEAKILAVDGAYCIVEYLGYLNHERQPLKSLRNSGGQKQRQLQIKSADHDEAADSEGSREEEPSTADSVRAKSAQNQSTANRTQDAKSSQSQQQQRQQQQLEHLLHLQQQHQRHFPEDGGQHTGATKQTKDSSRKRGANESPMPSMIAFPPPPPPFPPGVDEICASDEALAAMLISWYISGYHTGYYTAVRNNSSR